MDPDSNSDPESDPEIITDPDLNLQIITDPAGSGCTTLAKTLGGSGEGGGVFYAAR